MPEMAQIFTQESCIPNRRKTFNVELSGPYFCHVWAILGPCLSYFYNIFACRCLKWLKFLLKCHACQIEEYFKVQLFGPYWGHVWAIYGQVLAISTISLLVDALNGSNFH